MAVRYRGFKSWFTNNPSKAGFRCYQSDDPEKFGELPADGHEGTVLFIEYDGVVTRQMHSGQVWMVFWHGPDGLVIDGDSGPLEENVTARYPGCKPIRGRSVTPAVMREIEQEMEATTITDCGCE